MQCVQVKLELGHKATIRSKPTTDGFTHDWTVFVRGPEGSNIQHFVEKVVFHLHESFPKPKRVVKEPPYQVSESGYASFGLPIDVHFRNREEPKKVCFNYDLFLQLEGPPVNHIRCEKLTFQNPTEDFRRKLIKAGGVGILGPDGGTILGQRTELHTDTSSSTAVKAKASPDAAPKKHNKQVIKESTSRSSSGSRLSPVQEPFVALFGQPIKTSKASPDAAKKLKHETGNKTVKPQKSSSGGSSASIAPGTTAQPSTVSVQSGGSSTSRESKANVPKRKDKTAGGGGSDGVRTSSKRPPSPPASAPGGFADTKIVNKDKMSGKRPPSPPPSPQEETKELKKRKRSSAQPSAAKTVREKHSGDKRKKSKVKEPGEKKESSKSSAERAQGDKGKSSDTENVVENEDGARGTTVRKSGTHAEKEKHKSLKEVNCLEKIKSEPKNSPLLSSPDDSPDSSISFSSLHISGKQGPLGILMAEIDDREDDELVSPLSSEPPSPPRFSHQDTPPPPPPKPPDLSPKPVVERHSNKKSDKHSKKSDPNKSAIGIAERNPTPPPPQFDLPHLVDLQNQIMMMRDSDILQKIVDILEDTGLYSVNDETFDFDLCTLDKETLKKIQSCLITAF